jgi:hypothetical protein
MHATPSGVKLKIVKAELLDPAFAQGDEASFRVTVKNHGTEDAEEVIGVVTSSHDRLKVFTEMLRFGDIRRGGEGKATMELRAENIPPGRYPIKVVLSAVGVTATPDQVNVDIVAK